MKNVKSDLNSVTYTLSIILCLTMLMLSSCNPGDVCGPEKIFDCSNNCIDESDADDSLGDGTCDENLNCSEFNHDDDDCDSNTTTTTTNTTDNTCPGTPTVIYSGTTYNTVLIGDQCWLKENLNIGTMITTTPDQEQDQNNNGTMEKYCYDNNPRNCDTFGGLYQWDEAMQYTNSEGSQGICPEGWHIATLADFDTLKAEVNNDGNALKAIGEGTGSGAGTDTSGFSALLAGYEATNSFNYFSEFASFWSSTELNSFDKVNSMYLNDFDSEIYLVNNAKDLGFSIRCVKD